MFIDSPWVWRTLGSVRRKAEAIHGVVGVFLEDVWSRSFLNLFASSLTLPQYLLGLVVTRMVTSLIGL